MPYPIEKLKFTTWYSAEDEAWVAAVDDRPGLSGFGDSASEAVQECVIAASLAITACPEAFE